MISRSRLICVLDTNTIYPLEVRDFLFWLAYYELYSPKWSGHIFNEWIDVMKRKGIAEQEIIRRVNKANLAFPDAMVLKYSHIIDRLCLPDPKDRHVLAAAIASKAEVIITKNLKDFPIEYLRTFNVTVQTPDHFISKMLKEHPYQAVDSFNQMLKHRSNPVINKQEMLTILKKQGLLLTSDALEQLL
jgi:predicted nucleic acid-binding protein